jgi:hypothetical protein
MAVYSKILSDDTILSLIPTEAKKVLIVACGGCVNESLAYDNGNPIFISDENKIFTPYASYMEAQRIAEMLREKSFLTDIKTLNGDMPVLCIYHAEGTEILNTVNKSDIILTLSCKSGMLGLQTITKIPVISITSQVGYIAYTYKEEDGKKLIIKERSKIDII